MEIVSQARASEERQHDAALCDSALARVFDVLGKRWNGVILGSLAAGPVSFSRLARGIGGISDSVLSVRLSSLAAVGLVARTVDEGPPVSVTYRLTDAGRALLPALAELKAWAGEYLPEP